MGNWNITIRGIGPHHNEDSPEDANRMASAFVRQLKNAGHIIVSASITHGGEDDIHDTCPGCGTLPWHACYPSCAVPGVAIEAKR